MPKRNAIPDEVWDTYAACFEFGFMGVAAIARATGVSPQTVSREMKRRGALKCARLHETVEELEARLDRQKHNRELMVMADAERRRLVMDENTKAMGRLVALLEAADDRGDLSRFAPAMARMAKAPPKRRRRSRR